MVGLIIMIGRSGPPWIFLAWADAHVSLPDATPLAINSTHLVVCCRSLRCTRNTLHCHLIVTFMLKNLLWVLMHYVLPRLAENDDDVINRVN